MNNFLGGSAPYLSGNNTQQGSSLGGLVTAGKKKKEDDINPVQQFGYNPYQPSQVSLFGGPKPGLPKTATGSSASDTAPSFANGRARPWCGVSGRRCRGWSISGAV